MLVKKTDEDLVILSLEEKLNDAQYDHDKVEKEIRKRKAGAKAEREACYAIDFEIGHASDEFAVLHDVRVSDAERVAQIDHLLLHASGTIIVVETKNFSGGLTINENGEFTRWIRQGYGKKDRGEPIASPVAQGRRHALVLRDILKRKNIVSDPVIIDFVAVNSTARIDRPKNLDTSNVVKIDDLPLRIRNTLEERAKPSLMGSLFGRHRSSRMEPDKLRLLAAMIAELHEPASLDLSFPALLRRGANTDATARLRTQTKDSSKSEEQESVEVAATRLPCGKCGSSETTLIYGRHGYYTACSVCGKNTSVKTEDGSKIRKEGPRFFRIDTDGSETLLHVNSIATQQKVPTDVKVESTSSS